MYSTVDNYLVTFDCTVDRENFSVKIDTFTKLKCTNISLLCKLFYCILYNARLRVSDSSKSKQIRDIVFHNRNSVSIIKISWFLSQTSAGIHIL